MDGGQTDKLKDSLLTDYVQTNFQKQTYGLTYRVTNKN